MIFLYSVLVASLILSRFLVKRQAATLERQYAKIAQRTDALVRQLPLKAGNGSKPDACLLAKGQYQLGELVQARDRVEARYTTWQNRADTLARWLKGLRAWKGRKLPYTCGVVDVALVLVLIDWLGPGQIFNFRTTLDWVTKLMGR